MPNYPGFRVAEILKVLSYLSTHTVKKMRFDLIPHVGASIIKLGMSREEIRSTLGKPEHSTEKSVFQFEEVAIQRPAMDGYFNSELQITFDDRGMADFIEFSGRGAKHTKVFLSGVDVFHTPAPDLIRTISAITKTEFDKDEEEMPYTYVFPDVDLGVWRQVVADQYEDENQIPESDDGKYFWTIGIGVKGYYKKE